MTERTARNPAPFLLPAFADTTPPAAPLPWDRGQDVKDMAEYIRATLRQQNPQRNTATS